MYHFTIKNYHLLAEFSFNSKSFKWCYRNSIHFAKQALYLHDNIPYLTIDITKDDSDCQMYIGVFRTGLSIDCGDRIYEYFEEV